MRVAACVCGAARDTPTLPTDAAQTSCALHNMFMASWATAFPAATALVPNGRCELMLPCAAAPNLAAFDENHPAVAALASGGVELYVWRGLAERTKVRGRGRAPSQRVRARRGWVGVVGGETVARLVRENGRTMSGAREVAQHLRTPRRRSAATTTLPGIRTRRPVAPSAPTTLATSPR